MISLFNETKEKRVTTGDKVDAVMMVERVDIFHLIVSTKQLIHARSLNGRGGYVFFTEMSDELQLSHGTKIHVAGLVKRFRNHASFGHQIVLSDIKLIHLSEAAEVNTLNQPRPSALMA